MATKSKMFEVNGKRVKTWNPLGGECSYHCEYCWARRLIKQRGWSKYDGNPHLRGAKFPRFEAGGTVFVQSMSDLWGPKVLDPFIHRILTHCEKHPKVTFYFCTKNPKRYKEFNIPPNCICGCTIETDDPFGYTYDAPERLMRAYHMIDLEARKFLSIEPIMRFSLEFIEWITLVRPEFVYIGYDNYNSGLVEPPLKDVEDLIYYLTKNDIEVRQKTMRGRLI
jgi:protein gp37